MKCPQCGFDCPPDFKFCPQCATPLRRVCSQCGYEAPPDFAFCPTCGASLALSPDRDRERLEQTRRAIPRPQVDEMLGERKQVTVMFADVSGFTAMSETMDPEAVRDLMNACFECLVPVVVKYDGTVDKFIGDEIMALFGAPVAHENDPERALRAALEMMDALAEFNAERATDLGLHFGINTGLVIAGGIGTRERQEYSVMGDAVNLASRLEDASEAGQIFVSENSYRLTSRIFDFRELEPFRVKGKREPVIVYEVLGVKEKPESMRGLEGFTSSLIGRDEEFAVLNRCVERLLQGQGQIVSIIGEAGLGKSRLVAELRHSVVQSLDHSIIWVEGYFLSYGRSVTYLAFLKILRDLLEVTLRDREATVRDRLRERVEALFPERVREIYPYLGHLLSLELEEEMAQRVRHLDGESLKRQTFYAVREFLTAIANEKPLVIVFDDLHWADPFSIELLEYVMVAVEGAPLMLCCLYRLRREADCWRIRERAAQDHPHCNTEIELRPLSAEESDSLVSDLLEIQELPKPVREIISLKAEGNPFFVEEVLRSLIEGQAIVREDDHWRTTEKITDFSVPDTLQGVIMARIDRLEDEVKLALQQASVIGRTFVYLALAYIAEAREGLEHCLMELRHRELIREQAHIPELEYIFKHVLTQEVAYDSLLHKERRVYHRRVGRYLEETGKGKQLQEQYGLLAHHYLEGQSYEKSLLYSLLAAQRFQRMYAVKEAIEHYEQAQGLLRKVKRDTTPEQAIIYEGLGELHAVQGEFERALDDYARARELVTNFGELSRAELFLPDLHQRQAALCRKMGEVHEKKAEYTDALKWYDKGMTVLGDAQKDVEAARISLMKGLVYHRQGNPAQSLEWCQRSLALTEQLGASKEMARGYSLRGYLAHCYQGDDETALADCQRSLAIYEEIGDMAGASAVHNIMGTIYNDRAEWNKAANHYEQGLAIRERIMDVAGAAMLRNNLGEIYTKRGDLVRALQAYLQALNTWERTGYRIGIALVRNNIGGVYLRDGKPGVALEILEQSLKLFQDIGSKRYLPEIYRKLAEAHLGLGHQKEACSYGQRSLELAQKLAMRLEEGITRRVLGQVQRALGRQDEAEKLLRESLGILEELESKYEVGQTLCQLARLCMKVGKETETDTTLNRAVEIFAQLGAQLDLAEARQFGKTD